MTAPLYIVWGILISLGAFLFFLLLFCRVEPGDKSFREAEGSLLLTQVDRGSS